MDLSRQISEHLKTLAPQSLEILDESGHHVGHEGAKGGGSHFQLNIVSQHFSGKGRIERHRMIYAALGPLMQHAIHALAINARTPDEL